MAQKRLEALGRQAGGEQHRMFLGDAHVEIFVGMHGAEAVQAGAVGHGRRDGDDACDCRRRVSPAFGEDLRVGALAQRLGLAGLRIVRPQAVKLFLLLHRPAQSRLPFLGQHVQQHRPVQLLQKLEGADQFGDIVPVDRARSISARIPRRSR